MKVLLVVVFLAVLCNSCSLENRGDSAQAEADLIKITGNLQAADSGSRNEPGVARLSTVSDGLWGKDYIRFVLEQQERADGPDGKFYLTSFSGSGNLDRYVFRGMSDASGLVLLQRSFSSPTRKATDQIFLKEGRIVASRHTAVEVVPDRDGTQLSAREWLTDWNQTRVMRAQGRSALRVIDRKDGVDAGVSWEGVDFQSIDRMGSAKRVGHVVAVVTAVLTGSACMDAVFLERRGDYLYFGRPDGEPVSLSMGDGNAFVQALASPENRGAAVHLDIQRKHTGGEDGKAVELEVHGGYFQMDAITSSGEGGDINSLMANYLGQYEEARYAEARYVRSGTGQRLTLSDSVGTVILVQSPGKKFRSPIRHISAFYQRGGPVRLRACVEGGLTLVTATDVVLCLQDIGGHATYFIRKEADHKLP